MISFMRELLVMFANHVQGAYCAIEEYHFHLFLLVK